LPLTSCIVAVLCYVVSGCVVLCACVRVCVCVCACVCVCERDHFETEHPQVGQPISAVTFKEAKHICFLGVRARLGAVDPPGLISYVPMCPCYGAFVAAAQNSLVERQPLCIIGNRDWLQIRCFSQHRGEWGCCNTHPFILNIC
jgi:hypothetical protein